MDSPDFSSVKLFAINQENTILAQESMNRNNYGNMRFITKSS